MPCHYGHGSRASRAKWTGVCAIVCGVASPGGAGASPIPIYLPILRLYRTGYVSSIEPNGNLIFVARSEPVA